jgi:Flp pilus assembly protein TadB
MHELLRAMSLDEEGPDVQRALVQVLSDTSGRSLPAEAEADLEATRARERSEGNLAVMVAVALLLGAPLAAASIVLLGQPILAAAVAVLVLASAFLFLRTIQRLRARLDDAERRAALQTWHLRQLFPAGWRDRNSRPG